MNFSSAITAAGGDRIAGMLESAWRRFMPHEQAELTGTVHQGVIVIDDGVELPEGQTVKIIVQPAAAVEAKPESDAVEPADGAGKAQPALSPLAQMLLSHAGTIDDWPADFALNHDHYLYGADKRQ